MSTSWPTGERASILTEFQEWVTQAFAATDLVARKINCLGHKTPYTIFAAALTRFITADLPRTGDYVAANVLVFRNPRNPLISLATFGEGLLDHGLDRFIQQLTCLHITTRKLHLWALTQPPAFERSWLFDRLIMFETDLRSLWAVRVERRANRATQGEAGTL